MELCCLLGSFFPTWNNFHRLFMFYRSCFFLSLQGVEFQHTRTTDIKEKARLESQLKRIAGDTALLRQEISLLNRKGGYWEELTVLSRKDGCFFLQPSSPQDPETPTASFPVLTPETVSFSKFCYFPSKIDVVNCGSSHTWKCEMYSFGYAGV